MTNGIEARLQAKPNLPALPESAELVTADAAVALERQVARAIALVDDIDIADEWRRRAEALASYLAGTDGHGQRLRTLWAAI